MCPHTFLVIMLKWGHLLAGGLEGTHVRIIRAQPKEWRAKSKETRSNTRTQPFPRAKTRRKPKETRGGP